MSSPTVDARVGTAGPAGAPAGGASAQHPARRWWALAVIGLAQLMVVLDATIVNIALPSAQRDLGFNNDGRQWIITAYSLAFGSLLLLGGRLADLIGRRTTFLIGLVGFAAASALGGAANGFTMLVVARALQGMFGAVLAPSAMSLLTTTFTDPRERSKAFGVFGAIAGSGGAIGLLLGGVLTEHLNWRWTLYVNDGIAVFAVIGALLFIRGAAPAERPKLDLLGTLLVAGGLFGIVYGFSNAETHGWSNWMCWVFLAAGAVLVAAFVLWESRAKHPLLPLRVLADRNRAGSYVSVFISGAGMFGVFLFLTYYLQQTLGYTPVKTGLAFLPMVGMLMATAQLAVNLLIPRIGPKPVVPLGMAFAAGGMAWLTALDLNSTYAAHVLPPLLIMGFGLGMVMPPAMSLATLGVARHDQGVASATVNTMQQVGGSIGTALFNTVASTAATHYARDHFGTPNLAARAGLHSYSTAYWWAAGFFAAGLVITVLVYRRGRPLEQTPTVPEHTDAAAPEATLPQAAVPAAPAAPEAAPLAPAPTGPHGRVADPTGRPVDGAVVTLIDGGGRQLARAQAAVDGGYALPDPGRGRYVLVASAPGHQPQATTVFVGADPRPFDLTLGGGAALSGTVRGGGEPLAGALVVATAQQGEVAAHDTTSSTGTYRLADLVPGPYTLTVNAAGYQPTSLSLEVADRAPKVQDVDLQSAGVLSGVVSNPYGRQLEGARVTLLDSSGNVVTHRTTGPDGVYAFPGLASGDYTLVASGYPALSTSVNVRGAGRDDLDIELRHEG